MKKENSRQLLLDSYPLVAYLKDQKESAQVQELLLKAIEGKVKLYMSLISLGEVYYSMAKEMDLKEAESLLKEIKSLPIEFIGVNEDLVLQAARYKVKGNISYADCFVLSTASNLELQIITGDEEFKQFEKEVKILWLK